MMVVVKKVKKFKLKKNTDEVITMLHWSMRLTWYVSGVLLIKYTRKTNTKLKKKDLSLCLTQKTKGSRTEEDGRERDKRGAS